MKFLQKPIVILCFLLSTACSHVNAQSDNPCSMQKPDFLQVESFEDNKVGDRVGTLINAGRAAHAKANDAEAESYYAQAGDEIGKTNPKDWNDLQRPRERAMQLAAALWSSGHKKAAHNVWEVLSEHDRPNAISDLIERDLEKGDYQRAFKNLDARLDEYLGSGASQLMDFDDAALKKALTAGAEGRFADAYNDTRSDLYQCFGPDHITDLVGAMALMAQGKPIDEWMPLMLESSVRPYVPSVDMESFDQTSSLDAEILARGTKEISLTH